MGLNRTHRYGILAVGGASIAGAAGIIGRDVLLSLFMASATPAEQPNAPDKQSERLEAAIDKAASKAFGRRLATSEDYEIAAIGKLKMPSGHCTAQIAELPGYVPTETGTLLTTAAHCVYKGDYKDLEFVTTYINAQGQETDFKLVSTTENPVQVWINPAYDRDPDEKAVTDKVRAEDTALIFYPGPTPPQEITPIKQRVLAYHMEEYNLSVLNTFGASAAGFSGDIPQGKSVDDECSSEQKLNGGVVTTTCKINKGGSGSSLLVHNAHKELESLAVLSGVSLRNGKVNIGDDSFKSFYAPFYHHQLADVSFLHKPDQCVIVTPRRGANLRAHADIGSDTVGNALAKGQVARVRDTLDWEREEIGDVNVWLEVTQTEDGRSGYVRSDLVAEVNCP